MLMQLAYDLSYLQLVLFPKNLLEIFLLLSHSFKVIISHTHVVDIIYHYHNNFCTHIEWLKLISYD